MSLHKNDSTAAMASLMSYGADSEPDSDEESKTTGAEPTAGATAKPAAKQGLVSYEDDRKLSTGAMDDLETDEIDIISDEELPQIHGLAKVDLILNASSNSESAVALSETIRRTCSIDESEVRLPAEPTGRCSKHLQDKITNYYKKRFNLNHIQKRKDFRNPSIYDKLISYLRIDEFGSNYPSDVFDAHGWDDSSYYEALAKVQKDDMAKREKEKKERTKVEFKMGMVKKTLTGALINPITTTTAVIPLVVPPAVAPAAVVPPAAAAAVTAAATAATAATATATTSQAVVFTTTVPSLLSLTTSHSLPGVLSDEPERKRKSKWTPADNIRPLLPLPIGMVSHVPSATPIIPGVLPLQPGPRVTTVIPALGTLKKAKTEK